MPSFPSCPSLFFFAAVFLALLNLQLLSFFCFLPFRCELLLLFLFGHLFCFPPCLLHLLLQLGVKGVEGRHGASSFSHLVDSRVDSPICLHSSRCETPRGEGRGGRVVVEGRGRVGGRV